MPNVEFDLHAGIRKLAEAEWKCPECNGRGEFVERHGPTDFEKYACGTCMSAGRIVPFAALRVSVPLRWAAHTDCVGVGECLVALWTTDANGTYQINDCGGRGWIPEPDVEKACWRITKQFEAAELMVWVGRAGVFGKTKEEAVIRAVLSLVGGAA